MANNQSMTYGGTVPPLTFAVAGLVNGDTQGAVSSPAALTTTGSSHSNAGSDSITQGSLASDANYTVNFTSGSSRSTRRRDDRGEQCDCGLWFLCQA